MAVRIFRDFLADPALAIPAACALPAADDPFFKVVEAGLANAIRAPRRFRKPPWPGSCHWQRDSAKPPRSPPWAASNASRSWPTS
jgi:hypothetical protein